MESLLFSEEILSYYFFYEYVFDMLLAPNYNYSITYHKEQTIFFLVLQSVLLYSNMALHGLCFLEDDEMETQIYSKLLKHICYSLKKISSVPFPVKKTNRIR
jgi:hypothetical protein